MNEPLQGQKTSIVAGLAVLLQGAHTMGFVDDALAQLLQQALALAAMVTLALKARRAAKG